MRRTIAVAIVALACGCLVPKDQLDAALKDVELNGQKYKQEQEKTAALEVKIQRLEAEIQNLKMLQDELNTSLANKETLLTNKEAERKALEAKNEELAALNEELAKSTKKLEEAKAALEKRSTEYESLAESLKGEIEAGKVELSELKGRMTVKMKDKILFASGSANIGKEGQAALDKVAMALKDVRGKIIRVEGHTDDDPVDPKGPFASNWQLSLARAMAVVQHLLDQGVDPTKLSAAGYGQYQPIAVNDSPSNKSLNRRIEIVLANSEGVGTPGLLAAPGERSSPAVKTRTRGKGTSRGKGKPKTAPGP